MSKYGVGLRNVGSYMVSGRPYITGSVLNSNNEVKIQFPEVTNNITIRIPQVSNTATRIRETGVSYAAYWWGFPSDIGSPFNATGDGLLSTFGGSSDYTYSCWFRAETLGTPDLLFGFAGRDTTAGWRMWSRQASSTQFALYIKDAGNGDINNPAGADWNTGWMTINDISTEWNHLLITQHTGSTHFYINGSLAAKAASRTIIDSDNIQHGWNAPGKTAATSSFDEEKMWTVGMNYEQAAQVYNNGEWQDPNSFLPNNLQGWWTYGDDADGQYAPTITAANIQNVFINQATGTSRNATANVGLFRNTPGNEIIEYVDGPFTKQSVGKLRVTLLSTGSTSGTDIVSGRHYYELQGYGSSVTLPMKTKEIYLSAINSQITYEVYAELTNIPTASMYALTGSGIDE
jgi:hypothetical protein